MNKTLDLYAIERKTSNPRSQINWKPGQKELIADLYINQGLGYRAIGKLFNTEFHYNTIKRIVESHGGSIRTIREAKQESQINSNVFKTIDSKEKAYWLGFLEADGCVYKGYTKITLQKRDYNHLIKFQKFLNTNNSVKIIKHNNKEYCTISTGNQTIYEDLIRLGCVERKSLILKPCLEVPTQYIFDYIRGYWDGDGGLSYSQKNNRWQAYCTSTKEMLDFFVQQLNLNTKPFLEHRCKQTYRIHFNGRINVYNKMSLLYKNANIFLDRKYQLFLKLQESMLQNKTR